MTITVRTTAVFPTLDARLHEALDLLKLRAWNLLMEPAFEQMMTAERNLYVQALWDRIAGQRGLRWWW